jgi:Trk K+ transport system NAD-binding subunit
VVTTLSTVEVSRSLAILAFEGLRPASHVAGAMRDEIHVRALRLAGVNRVINPFLDAADHAAQTITEALSHSEDTS